MNTSRHSRRLLPLLLLVPCMAPAADAPPEVGEDAARIGQQAGSDMRGRIAINQAAGSGNAQANLAAIAFSQGGTGLTGLQASQHPGTVPDYSRPATARIEGAAFAGSHGVLSVNQVAGSGNAQANLFAIGQYPMSGMAGDRGASAINGLDDAALAAVAGDTSSESTDTTVRIREARIADEAFRGSQGVVQVNQTAGVGNLSTNAIVLQLPGGTP